MFPKTLDIITQLGENFKTFRNKATFAIDFLSEVGNFVIDLREKSNGLVLYVKLVPD